MNNSSGESRAGDKGEKRGEEWLCESRERQEIGREGEEIDGERGRVHGGKDVKVVLETKGGIGGLC